MLVAAWRGDRTKKTLGLFSKKKIRLEVKTVIFWTQEGNVVESHWKRRWDKNVDRCEAVRHQRLYGLKVPLHKDAFVGSQEVEAVQDSVAGDLDIIHCSNAKAEVRNPTLPYIGTTTPPPNSHMRSSPNMFCPMCSKSEESTGNKAKMV